MKITRVHIKNFRKLLDVSAEFAPELTVIVGPNGMGKSSLFEAIRLCKSVLMPRTPDEVQQVLVALGVSSPNIMFGEFQYDYASLAGDVALPMEISLNLKLTVEEIHRLKKSTARVAELVVGASLGQSNSQSRFALIQFLSSPEGLQRMALATTAVDTRIDEVATNNEIVLSLVITQSQIRGANQLDQALASILEAQVEPARALFSYFPADRAMPAGEVNVQLHSADMKAHVDSHFANAATKYPRLKQVIVNLLLARGGSDLEKEFSLIFDNLLPGKKFIGIAHKAIGTISVRIRDIESNREFDIDSMSSGEKGLVLTYLLLRTSLATGGIALIDEPELHLNPAVCKKLLAYLHEHICLPLEAQVVICTHSAEILTLAFESDKFSLFELVSPKALNPLLKGDREEMFDALRRLGVPPADSLVYRGFVFVEGDEDVRLYERGFSEALQGLKVVQKKGRKEVEKEIGILQKAEKEGKLDKIHLFIFDNDRNPVSYTSTKFVRVVQLERYCIENYLLEDRYLFDLIKPVASNAPANRAELEASIKLYAMHQLTLMAASEVYGVLQELSCGARYSKLRGKDAPEIAEELLGQMRTARITLNSIDEATWAPEFAKRCSEIVANKKALWEKKYLTLASGKMILEDLHKAYQINQPLLKIKLDIIEGMAKAKTDSWKAINRALRKSLE